MAGLITWESSLRKGRLPLDSDFDHNPWPEEPLFTAVHDTLSSLALPRLVRRRPEIMTSVLLSVAKVVVEYITLQRRGVLSVAPMDDELGYDEHEDEYTLEEEDMDLEIQQEEYVSMSMDELEKLAETLSEKLAKEWSGVVRGMSILDGLFGYNHQMLDLKVSQELHSIWMHKVTNAATHVCSFLVIFVIGRKRIRTGRWNMATQRMGAIAISSDKVIHNA
jgi:hypothetical protein